MRVLSRISPVLFVLFLPCWVMGQATTDSALSIAAQAAEAFRKGQPEDIEQSIGLWREAMVVHTRTNSRMPVALLYQGLGAAYKSLSRHDSALTYLGRALALYRSARDRQQEAITMTTIGAVHFGLGRPDSALAYYALALPMHRAAGNRSAEAGTLDNLGMTHGRWGHPDSALLYYVQA
jgi:tetratricopeptide (TPR) repeat protein